MICVRCSRDAASRVAQAPDGSQAWEVYFCSECHFSWRSTEGEEICRADRFNPAFKLEHTDLKALPIGIPMA